MAAVKMNTADKTQLAGYRLAGFPTGEFVAVKSGGEVLFGSVVESNGFITTVLTFSPALGEVITRSWATRSVKLARFAA